MLLTYTGTGRSLSVDLRDTVLAAVASLFVISIVIVSLKLRIGPMSKVVIVLGGVLLVALIAYLTIKKVYHQETRSVKATDSEHQPKEGDKEELVVAVCSEDLSWIDKKAGEYHKVTVYNKCGKEIKFDSPNVVVQDNPNIGTCDYAFLTYIIERYNNLPEFIEFTKGSEPGNHEYPGCLACYTDNHISLEELRQLKELSIDDHSFKHHPHLALKYPWVPSGHPNFKSWLNAKGHLDLVDRSYCNIIYGGHFGATREQIKRTPLKVYEALRKEQKYPREEVDHFIERLWRPLLCRPRYNLVVVGIFKNEAVAMREWLLHHIGQGVEHFYLINNGSTDDWQSQVDGLPVTVYNDNEKHKQTQHYNDYFLDIVKVEALWVAVIDLDEFLYARDPYTDIPSFLRTVPNQTSQVLVRWKMFGSNGHIKQPPSIKSGFSLRKAYAYNAQVPDNSYISGGDDLERLSKLVSRDMDMADFHTKSIVRTVDLTKFGMYVHETANKGKLVLPYRVSEDALASSPLHLNHYAIQSLNWYNDVKLTRGDASNVDADKIRNAEYFKKYDFKEIEDLELSRIIDNDVSLWNKPSLDSIRKVFTRVTPKQWKDETVEQELIHKYLLPGDTVFELGGNIGRSSIIACQVVGVNGSLVVSESDEKNRKELAQNMRGALCNFRIVPAFSDTPLYQQDQDPDLGARTQNTPGDGLKKIKTLPYRELSSHRPTVLVIDCEGCFDDILHKAGIDLSNVHTIIIENDGSEEQNKRIKDTLLTDFTSVECRGLDNNNCFWQVLQRQSIRESTHIIEDLQKKDANIVASDIRNGTGSRYLLRITEQEEMNGPTYEMGI